MKYDLFFVFMSISIAQKRTLILFELVSYNCFNNTPIPSYAYTPCVPALWWKIIP